MSLEQKLEGTGLMVVGHFRPGPDDGVPEDAGQLVLLGADPERFWPIFSSSPEMSDCAPHPMDRWSRRVISGLAGELGAQPLFPFDGPPWPRFQHWAGIGEHARTSPIAMQVSPSRGLWMSYRGALAFAEPLELPQPASQDPCLDCPAPCQTACPVEAFRDGRYDVPACVEHLETQAGRACHDGCLARLACPIAQAPLLPQRQFHMRAFLAAQRPVAENSQG